jgi:hypothetical protein
MPDKQKSVDYKTTAVEYFLVDDTIVANKKVALSALGQKWYEKRR